jgi:RNA polymerase sigma-70 factor (ECF subfamily)
MRPIKHKKGSCALDVALTHVAGEDIELQRIEPEDFDGIVARHQRQIYRVLLCMVRDADTADTLTQECFLRAFKKRGRFRGESSLATWLVRIAINLAHDHNRSRRLAFWRKVERPERMDAIRSADWHRSPEQALMNRESVDAVRSAAEKLPDRQRTVFLLRFVEEMPLEAIAEATGLKLGTVKSHLFRGIEAVKASCNRKM